jgi:hypothetical protein
MTDQPSLLIQFDPTIWKPTAIFTNGSTDEETAKLREITDKLLRALPLDREAVPLEAPEP